MQRQQLAVCRGCGTVLFYPRGAINVCCGLCHLMTFVPPPEMETAQLICRGCRMLITHDWGVTSVQCSCCCTVNLAPAPSAPAPQNIAHVNCASCQTMLIYPVGAPLVRCAICGYIGSVNTGERIVPFSLNGPSGVPSVSRATAYPKNETLVVKNPATVDENGKLVRTAVVGITT